MATTVLPQLQNQAFATPQLNSLNATIVAAGLSTSSPDTSQSPICSTPLAMFNPGYQPLVQYIQPSNQYSQPISVFPIATANVNVFEGVPIFLLPQSSSSSSPIGTPSQNVYQRAVAEMRTNWSPRNQSPKIDTSNHFHVFVGDLSAEVDNCMLKAAFQKFGEVSEAKVIRDSRTLKSRGYGFVSFPIKEHAEKAIEKMNGQMIGRRQIRTNWAVRKLAGSEENAMKQLTYEEIFNATHAANTSVYVGGITPTITEEELMQLFATIATVSEVRLFKQQGYAFVRYLTKEAATQAIITMNGKELNGQKIRCSWGRTPVENNNVANQAAGCFNLLNNNAMGFNSNFMNPTTWNQNQYLLQFYGQPLLHNWLS